METVGLDWSNLSDVVKIGSCKKTIFNELGRKVNRIQIVYFIDDKEFVKKSDCVTTTRVIENKVPDYSKYVTTSDYVQFTRDIIQEKWKNKKIK